MDAGSEKTDAIREMAYIELMIYCEEEGCVEVFAKRPTAPEEEWAERFAREARDAGWATDAKGRVLCPEHATR